ncbi:type II secretion system F family protein [Janibacter cremeus]|uniref:type II secretion system F family protein n=1 Tax=Janibacter cremeus TaxID=1285192 RepID=UPI0023F649DC|nr:type II secretion system F family protein [Janibacter cremeus]WEV76990.1 type II secretion system F family protein [Janibacter cremeus]
MIRLVQRIFAAMVLAVVFAALSGTSASAAPDVSMSDVESRGDSLTGVLTFRGSEVIQVDPGSLTATIDGRERDADVASSTSVQRSSMLVIDTSGSMGVDGMATVRAATRAYLAEVPKDVKVGVATFANTAGVDLRPSADRQQVRRIVNGLAARGETSLYAGVLAAAKALGNDGDRSMVLLSDGADTVSTRPKIDLVKATKAVRERGVRVDVVRFRTEDKDTMNALDGFAEAGDGSVLAADDAEAVGDAFQSAARALNSQAPFEITTPEQLSGRHVVRLEGSANGDPFAVERMVTLDGSPEAQPDETEPGAVPAHAEPAASGWLASSPWPWLGAFAIGTAIFLLAFGTLTPTVRSRRELRLAGIDAYVVPAKQWSRREGREESKAISERLVDFGERRMAKRGSTARTMQLVNRADLPLRAGEWYVLCGVAIIVAIAVFMVVLPGPWLVGVLVGLVVGLIVPQVLLRVLAARRARAFERALPDSLVLVATSLKSGFGLMQSLDAVAQDSAPPVDKEFARALAETRIGTDIADALERLAERMGSQSMAMAVMAIRIQREVGGNLAETLQTTAHTLREREVLFRQVKALSAEGRLSAYILIALPFALFFYMLLVNFEYVQLLWTTAFGLLMSIGALVGITIGIFWMSRVVKIEV